MTTLITDQNEIVSSRVEEEIEYVTELRHRLHQHPEIKYEESHTRSMICEELDALQIDYKTGFAGGNGIVAHLPSTEPDGDVPCVALRADMDALPIEEKTGKPWASSIPGRMHACGHDGHMAVQVGAARVLASLDYRAIFRPAPITMIFQPAEEGGAGAKYMCQDGALKGTEEGGLGSPVRFIYGLHGWPELPLGIVGSTGGPLMAATTKFKLMIQGQQAHAALPHLSRDPIVASAQVITALQSVVSRNINPMNSAIVTIGMVSGGSTHNIIPTSVEMLGTARTFDVNMQRQVHARIETICDGVAKGLGCEATVAFDNDGAYPVLVNSHELAEAFFSVASRTIGPRSVFQVEPWMGGEDFAFYGREKGVESLFYFLGLRPSKSLAAVPQLHQPTFDFDDRALAIGMRTQCALALTDHRQAAPPFSPRAYGKHRFF